MSDFTIRDGRGTGSLVGVDSEGRLNAKTLSIPRASERTITGNQFVIPVGVRAITTTSTEHPILRVNPTAANKRFHAQRFFLSVLNSTPVLFKLYRGSAAPTANNVSFAPGNANTNSVTVPSIAADVWNGVGTGMTISANGTEAFAAYFGQGATDVPIEGTQIWGLNAAILVTATCSVANNIAALITGWEEDA